MGCCLPPPSRPDAPGGQYYESHERSVEFRAYSWSDAEWVCHSCHAVWVVEPPSDAQRDDGVLQVSRHEGGQRVFLAEGPRRDVPRLRRLLGRSSRRVTPLMANRFMRRVERCA